MLPLIFFVGLLVIAVVYLNRYSLGADGNTIFALFVVLGAVMLVAKSILIISANI